MQPFRIFTVEGTVIDRYDAWTGTLEGFEASNTDSRPPRLSTPTLTLTLTLTGGFQGDAWR